MRRSAFVLVTAAAVLASAPSCKLRGHKVISTLASLVSFEGEIDMSVSMMLPSMPAKMPSTMATLKLEIKGDKSRTETPGLGMASISDATAKKMWMLDPTARTYTELDLATAGKAVAAASTAAPKPKTKVTKTGRTDVVAGYSCDVYEVDDPSGAMAHTELCMASGLSMMALGLTGPFSMLSAGDDEWKDVLSHGFPLRVLMRDATGAPLVKMEATRIEKKSLPDSEFQVPPGYTKTASPFGSGGFGGPSGGGGGGSSGAPF
jgi:hypothetical protein